ncbi:MAG: LarC family nickel insertion protein [Proteobacteria bacterium]|nr:MAG: LarC family nickel insertion protein [Pseudomonadota bacterium]QKK12594.1 MAG: LarC family nickel insertion protein [Pseudomonadota bacterium]
MERHRHSIDHSDHAHGYGHGHSHHHHGHSASDHLHEYGREVTDPALTPVQGSFILIRPASGLSGDMLVAGLARLACVENDELSAFAAGIGLPEGCIRLERRAVNEVYGWACRVSLPHEHSHRTLNDIRRIIFAAETMSPRARQLAEVSFTLLAEAEGRIHGIPTEAVTFHEVGALDSILDMCLACILFDRMDPTELVCGPLPLCDGTIRCSHGLLPAPAPAVLDLIQGMPVRGIPSEGETVTPTAIALLKGLGARFGPWPSMTVSRTALVFGTRILPDVANGALFALGNGPIRTLSC